MAAQQFWAQVFYGLVFFVSAGFLWFFVVRPILEGWGIIRARDYVTTDDHAEAERIAGTPGRNAVERPTERPSGNPVPINRSALFARILSTLPEDELIDTLAQMTNPDGSWRYAESRIGKFAPGRLEDRIEQVRRIRGTDPAPKPPPGPQFEQVGPNSFRRVEGT